MHVWYGRKSLFAVSNVLRKVEVGERFKGDIQQKSLHECWPNGYATGNDSGKEEAAAGDGRQPGLKPQQLLSCRQR